MLSRALEKQASVNRQRRRVPAIKILVADIGGTHVKLLDTGHREPREFFSGPTLTPGLMVSEIKRLVSDWEYGAVSMGYPGPVIDGRRCRNPAI